MSPSPSLDEEESYFSGEQSVQIHIVEDILIVGDILRGKLDFQLLTSCLVPLEMTPQFEKPEKMSLKACSLEESSMITKIRTQSFNRHRLGQPLSLNHLRQQCKLAKEDFGN